MRPRNELGNASAINTSTNCPAKRGCPMKLTTRLFSVLPCICNGFFFDCPSTNTVCTVPIIASEIAAVISLMRC